MKALSIRAPWWWFILHGGKDIENRDWYTNYRGTVLVHASKWFNSSEVMEDWDYAAGLMDFSKLDGVTLAPGGIKALGGHIVGQMDIVGCVRQSSSPWFQGKYGFVLKNAIAFDDPYPVRGALGFFDAASAVKGDMKL